MYKISGYRLTPIIFLFTAAVNLLIGCKSQMVNSIENETSSLPQKKSLLVQGVKLNAGQILQLNNYPLFVMDFSGNYGFKEFLNSNHLTVNKVNIDYTEPLRWGCTCFSAFNGENKFFGRNFDYYHHASLILFTHPNDGYSSISSVDIFYLGLSSSTTLEQIRQAGSLSGSPYCAFDGMNEKGVAIGFMSIPKADPPYDAAKKNLTCLEIVRLVLDYAANVDEAIALLPKYNYYVEGENVHFMIADKTGKSAIIEFINKEMKTIYNTDPFQVCTNFIITGSQAPQSTSCWRYNAAYNDLKNKTGKLNGTTAMNLLSSVSQGITMWSCAYNLDSLSLDIAVGKNYSNIYSIRIQ